MKKVFLILLGLVFFACTSVEKEGTVENELSQEANPDGPYLEYYPNGLKKMEGQLVNGQRHGNWTYYYENGMKWSEGKFVHGQREGYSIIYHENGKKKIEGQYKNNLLVGEWKVWEDDGSFIQAIDLNKMLSHSDSLLLNLK